ncbi:MAG TPA: hypothetical protein VNI20_08845 [Fimbriimonadaceae bacterium]|nr:hypothetical protein [Fimbriimonadaceae bacterium]
MSKAVVLVALVSFAVVLSQENHRQWGPPHHLCDLDDADVRESSGIAPSRMSDGVYYTHNDSGDTARFFRFDRKGHVSGVYLLDGVNAIDCEDIASAIVDGTPYIYLGDIGDNFEHRKSIAVYRTKEPSQAGDNTLEKFDSYTIKYPDGPHNCEALFVTQSGDIWLATKEAGGITHVYRLPKPAKSGTYVVQHVADVVTDTGGLGGKLVTGGDISPDGKHVVLRTYTAAMEFDVPSDIQGWVKSTPHFVRLAVERQGEGICYSRDGHSLLTTSEFAPCPVTVLSLEGP